MAATTSSLSTVYPLGSRVNERGALEVGGCDVVELAGNFGTPAYALAEDDLRARARSFMRALADRSPGGEVLFASKALPCVAVERIFVEEGLGCDVASGGELALALRAGFAPDRIYLHGNAKSPEELGHALQAGVGTIVIDNLDELEALARLGPEHQRVLLRVTPGVHTDTHASIATGQTDSKFGVALASAPDAIARIAAVPGLKLAGLHIHLGSQLMDTRVFELAAAAIASLGEFPVYGLGGGLAAAHVEGAHPPAIEDFVAAQVAAADRHLGAGRRLVLEPGRSLVANAGVTLYTVMSVKRSASTWVAVDGGMSDNLRPMLYGAQYEAQVADRLLQSGGSGEHCVLAGKHCESGDVIARDVVLDAPRAGDVVVTPATGAYCHALANNYNGVPRPPVILCRDGDARVVVRRETYEDLLAREQPGDDADDGA
ncbi:MAG: diaminopimelate decarboxylase [Solirubrobacterales bacterium]|nr:MAG: diaminopimelate decarboxylase [Solirubrobacterales bacterium]